MKNIDTGLLYSAGADTINEITPMHRWRYVVIFTASTITCALCFLRYIGWAAFYSGIEGLSSRASEAHVADHKAQVFFWAAVLLVLIAASAMTSLIRLEGISSTAMRVAARFLVSLSLTFAVSAVLILVVVEVGSRFR